MQLHYYAEYYVVEDSHWWFRARRRILRSMLEQAGLWGRGLRMLDVGCGTGRMLQFLREGIAVIGLDREMEALKFAAKGGASCLLQADGRALPIRAASLDVIGAFDLLEHLEDDWRALEEFRRVLKPGGHCVVTVPAFRALWSEHDDINVHWRRYRRGELCQRWAEAGFLVTRCSYFNTLLFAPIAMVRAGRRLLGRLVASSRRHPEGCPRSDFSIFHSSVLGSVLGGLMGFEAWLLRWFDLPIGLSIVCIAKSSVADDQ